MLHLDAHPENLGSFAERNRFMKKVIRAVLTVIFCQAAFISTASAQTVLAEPFTYSDGPLVGAAGSPWTTSSGTAGQQNVVGGRLFIDDNETEDTLALFSAGVTFGSVTAVFDLQMDPADIVSSAAGNYIAHFIGTTNASFVGRLFMITDPAGTGTTFRIGVSTGAGTPTAIFSSVFTLGTTYSLSLTYDLTTNLASLSAAGFGTITATDVVDDNNIRGWGFRQSTTHGDVFFDNLEITAIPEPATYMLFGMGLLVCAQQFRRRRAASNSK